MEFARGLREAINFCREVGGLGGEEGHCSSRAVTLFLSLKLVIFINHSTVASLECMAGH